MAGPSVELLQRVPLFAEISKKELQQLSSSFKERTFAEGEDVAVEGETGGGGRFFVIESGEAVVTVHGQEHGRLGAGDYFGDVAMIDRGERTATIHADSELKCWSLTFWDFRPLVETDPRVAWPLLQVMAKRLRAAEAESA
jgi:CRP/FNR family transcriptional regulator, cyclic AMP receptor protein